MNPDKPSTWKRFRPALCEGCHAYCSELPVEVTAEDLVTMLIRADDLTLSLKKVARKIIRSGWVRSFRARSGLFVLAQRPGGECVFLGRDRRCTLYERRPSVCRKFPENWSNAGVLSGN